MREGELKMSKPALSPGVRVQLSSLGKERCPRIGERHATVVWVSTTQSYVRILIDGTKTPRSIHTSYIELLSELEAVPPVSLRS
jgi:hypothetical protein